MPVAFVLSHLKLAGYAAVALVLICCVAWVDHLIKQHNRDQAQLGAYASELQAVGETNAANLAAFAQYKAQAAILADEAAARVRQAQAENAWQATTQKEIHRVAKASPAASGPGPATLYALGRMREHHAAALGDKGGNSKATTTTAGTADLRP